MALIIELKVMPSSGRSMGTLDKSGMLKIYLKSPAQKGLANQELIRMFSKALKIDQANIVIVSGLTSPKKRLKINSSLNLDQVLSALGIERQLTAF